MPRISVIVATRNAAASVRRCLESVVDQSSHDWELLVADGASEDGTVEILRSYADRLAWWDSQRDGGIYEAWNRALREARGDYVMFLGADDVLHDADVFARILTAIGDREFDLVTGRGVLVDASGRQGRPYGEEWSFRRVMRRITVCQPGLLHRRELFDRFGRFDESYRICADYEFLLRLPASVRSHHVDRPVVLIGSDGVSRRHRIAMLRETWRAQARCPRIGRLRATFNYMDKLWRIPVARLLGVSN